MPEAESRRYGHDGYRLVYFYLGPRWTSVCVCVRTLNFLDGLLLAPSEWWGAVCVCVRCVCVCV